MLFVVLGKFHKKTICCMAGKVGNTITVTGSTLLRTIRNCVPYCYNDNNLMEGLNFSELTLICQEIAQTD